MRGRRSSNPIPSRRRRWTRAKDYGRQPPRKHLGGAPGFTALLVMLPLAVFAAVFAWDGGPDGFAMPFGKRYPTVDSERTSFTRCGDGARFNCVVDGDTFWYQGTKIRIADINTPEVSNPGCAREAQLGEAATSRLLTLLNGGAFSLSGVDRDEDTYGRKLRVVSRDGQSLGEMLVSEGYAERWQGYRRDWC